MNDAYRATNMLLEYLRQLDPPTVSKLQIETDLIRIKRLLVTSNCHETQDLVLQDILKLFRMLQELCANSDTCRIDEMVPLVHQLAEKASKMARHDQ